MTDLLTHAEYRRLPMRWIRRVVPLSMESTSAGMAPMMTTTNPATGIEITNFDCNAQDVDFAVTKAREAFDQGRWSKLDPTRARMC